MNFKYIQQCRLCDSFDFSHVLHLTPTPPANEFVKEPIAQDIYPLDLLECSYCGHVQLSCVVDPEILFKHYIYVSGTSPSFVKHFEDYADQVISKIDLKVDSNVLDIGSNDGTLLKIFKSKGMAILGVDPAVEISKRANEDGIPTINSFFDKSCYNSILQKYKKFNLIFANNIFGHADNLREIATGVFNLLSDDGVFVFEVSNLSEVIKNKYFDIFYHEHVSENHLAPLISFFTSISDSFRIFDVEKVNTHGGSLRIYVTSSLKYKINESAIREILVEENYLGLRFENSLAAKYEILKNHASPFTSFAFEINSIKNKVMSRLNELKKSGKTIAAYGAPAKMTTFNYHFGLDNKLIDYVFDDSPLKQGLLTPGQHIPVLPSSEMYVRRPDYVLILAWNFADQIIANNQKYLDDGGHFIVPMPDMKEY